MKIENIISNKLWDTVESNYKSGKYANAITDAMLYLTNVLREKSDLDTDGTKLVGSAFSKTNPKIKINRLETETERNMQEGLSHILRGLYQLIRNPRHHEKMEDTENEATQIILFIDYILKIIEKSKSKYDVNELVALIFDEQFVGSDEYVTLLVDRIPKRKLFEVLIKVYRNKHEGNIDNLEKVYIKIFSKLSDNDIDCYLQIVSDDLLKTNDDNERKYIVRSFPSEYWTKIDEIAKLRTENHVINCLIDIECDVYQNPFPHWLPNCCTHLYEYFALKNELFHAVSGIFDSNKEVQKENCLDNIIQHLWKILDEDSIKKFITDNFSFKICSKYYYIEVIKDEIEKGNRKFYDYVKSNRWHIPRFVLDYYKDALDNYKEVPSEANVTDDDVPF